LLDFGADPTTRNSLGLSCLHIAAKAGSLEICLLLIARGCDPNIRDDFGNNAAYWAKDQKHFEMLTYLPSPMTVNPAENKEYIDQGLEHTYLFTPDEIKKMQAIKNKEAKAKAKAKPKK
jgi:ankyrin repeat protein